MAAEITRDEICAAVGQGFGCSDWFTMDQARVDAFAAVTDDHLFIHTDPARAKAGPFGGTVAHGMLTLSMVSAMAQEVLPHLSGQRVALNYGIDKVRFPTPVPTGARIRGHFELTEVKPRGRDSLMCRFAVRVEIEDNSRAALTADWSLLYMF